MRTLIALAMMFAGCGWNHAAEPRMIPFTELGGTRYVAGTDLTRSMAIAIKDLPGSQSVAVCFEERCARLKEYLRKDGETYVAIEALTHSLGLNAQFSEDPRRVRFDVGAAPEKATDGVIRVGDLAPNLRLTLLKGGEISLAELRGKRVLINSWASW